MIVVLRFNLIHIPTKYYKVIMWNIVLVRQCYKIKTILIHNTISVGLHLENIQGIHVVVFHLWLQLQLGTK